MGAAAALVVSTIGLFLLAQSAGRATLRRAVLLWSLVAAVAVCWAPMAPGAASEQLIDRVVMVLIIAVLAAALYGLVLVKGLGVSFRSIQAAQRTDSNAPWRNDAAAVLCWVVCLAGASLVFVLACEAYFTLVRSDMAVVVPISGVSIAATIVVLIGAIVTLVAFAVGPGRDPLGLPASGRAAHVYAAEALMASTFLHVRLSMPWLFTGFFQQYWPLIVMLIAFFGVGLSEFFRRRDRLVLARPLANTGAFLPLLPVLGFWTLRSSMDYSALLLIVGMLYGVLAVMRRALGFGVLAALAANGGLWYFLKDTEHFKLWQHPQLWLIPPSVCVLGAAQLNRDRLNEAQITAIRYICLILVYVSSTVDIFIRGVSHSPWLPLILAALSVAGVLGGIMLRIQSFLFVGTAFLLLALVTIVWHAAAMYQMTWLWYVAGICLGSAIIALFALFEKKRAAMLGMIDGLRQWRG